MRDPKDNGPGDQLDDVALLREALGDVTPLVDRDRVPLPAPPPVSIAPFDEDEETIGTLTALVSGEEPFDSFPHCEEYAEWAAEDAPPGFLPRLSSGDFPFQAYLDLHGFTRDQARVRLESFLTESRALSRLCVLVIHGRGKRSPNGESVLRKAVHHWLSRGGLGRGVLAYSTALAVDGGAGAIYVLLRES